MPLRHVSALKYSGVPRNFFGVGGVQQIQLRTEDRENEYLGAVAPYPLVKDSGGSCNLVHSKSFLIFGILRLFMMTTNLFVIVNIKQLRTQVVLEFYCFFFRTSWSVGVLNSAIFNSFHNRGEFGTILEVLRNFGEGFEHPNPPSVRHC